MKTFLLSLLLLFSAAGMTQTYNVTDFGAVGNGSTVNTSAIQAAVDSCSTNGGTVLIPAGTFVSGTIILKNNVTLRVDGTLKGSSSVNDYPEIFPNLRSMADANSQRALIYAENASGISITGDGVIDGNGFAFLNQGNNRPYGIRLISCRNVKYENIELKNAGFWMMHNLDIDTLTIRGITVSNNSNSNNDGIGIDACRNVLIENCTVSSLDDPMVLKTTTPLDCENVVVRNCTISTVARAIKIGTETTGGFRNILIENCVVQPHSLIPIADCGINLAIVDGGFIDGLVLRNIAISGVKTALFLRLGNQGRKYTPSAPVPPVGYVKNITFKNIIINSESNLTSSITGIPGFYAENITLEDITIHFPGGEEEVRSGYVVPENEASRPNCDIFGDTMPAHGLYVRHVKNIRLSNVCFHAQAPDQRPPLMMDDVQDSPDYIPVMTGSGTYCLPELPSGINYSSLYKPVIVPNPQRGSVSISLPGVEPVGSCSIEIFDISGRKIFGYEGSGQNEFLCRINAVAGVYCCVLRLGGKLFSGKFAWLSDSPRQ